MSKQHNTEVLCPATLPFAITEQEMKGLMRFHECVTDGEGYDVPKERMKQLSEIGLVRRVSGNIYEHTTFGLSVINGDFRQRDEEADRIEQLEATQRELVEALEEVRRRIRMFSLHDAGLLCGADNYGKFTQREKLTALMTIGDVFNPVLDKVRNQK